MHLLIVLLEGYVVKAYHVPKELTLPPHIATLREEVRYLVGEQHSATQALDVSVQHIECEDSDSPIAHILHSNGEGVSHLKRLNEPVINFLAKDMASYCV